MLQGWVILLVSVLYLSVLFAIAYYGDKRADQKQEQDSVLRQQVFQLGESHYELC